MSRNTRIDVPPSRLSYRIRRHPGADRFLRQLRGGNFLAAAQFLDEVPADQPTRADLHPSYACWNGFTRASHRHSWLANVWEALLRGVAEAGGRTADVPPILAALQCIPAARLWYPDNLAVESGAVSYLNAATPEWKAFCLAGELLKQGGRGLSEIDGLGFEVRHPLMLPSVLKSGVQAAENLATLEMLLRDRQQRDRLDATAAATGAVTTRRGRSRSPL